MSKKVFFIIAILLLATIAVYAQTGVGQIQGVVTDAAGALVPNAAVTLENLQTGNKFESTTAGNGSFLFPSLQTGDYQLTVVSPGMKKWQGKATLRGGQ